VTTMPATSRRGTIPQPGLTSREADELLKVHGPNVLTPPARAPWWALYLEKFEDPVIRILMVAAFVAIVVGFFDGHYAEGLGIIAAIILATTLAFLNEYKAGKEFAILSRVDDDVQVGLMRDGTITTVQRRALVPGDVMLIEKGDEVPADGMILDAVALEIDEAQLTGESVPVRKCVAGEEEVVVSERAYPPDRVYRGTIVAEGRGTVHVVATGDRTEIGQTARLSNEETDEETPLNQQLRRLSKLIGVIGTGMALVTFAALVARGVITRELVLTTGQWLLAASVAAGVAAATVRVWLPIAFDGLDLAGRDAHVPAWLEREGFSEWLKAIGAGLAITVAGIALVSWSGVLGETAWLPRSAASELLTYFMIAVTIIVVAVPEGLAMSVTLSLAYSMRKMTATNTLVRRMHACETIGATTVICSDKTGTLTMNQMRVAEAVLPWRDGAGHAPPRSDAWLAEAVAVNSTAHLDRSSAPRPVGNPTEGALLLWLDEAGHDYAALRASFRVAHQWTFSTERKFMATIGTSAVDGESTLYVKGAPEILLERSSTVLTSADIEPIGSVRSHIEAQLRDLQSRAYRTLGIAMRRGIAHRDGAELDDVARELTWLGFVAIADPVRAEVPAAIDACRRAGIGVKMVTGDNPQTASQIGRTIGLLAANPAGDAGSHVSGRDFAPMNDDTAARAAARLEILSRAKPADKLKLVRVLQQQGEVVAVTGDGVNDAPALNHADVGLAMGITGNAVAKQSSDIVLLDDSFQSIVKAVMWGRSLYENIQRFILFQLTINVVALGIAFVGPFIGVKLPLTVTQMLWINLIMDTFAALALATEPPHHSVMQRPPRRRDAFIITPAMGKAILGTGGVFLALLVGLLLYLSRDGAVDNTELSAFFSVFVLLQFWNLFNARSLGRTRSALEGLTSNRSFILIALAILGGQIVIVQFGGSAFRTVPLSWSVWAAIIATTSPVLLIGEAWRWSRRRGERRVAPMLAEPAR
jgi:Ca2+-transporting ATPase